MPQLEKAVFFYGLFMDIDLLRSKGATPVNARRACVSGFTLRIGQRFNLSIAPAPHERNPEYAATLRDLAQRLALPASYVEAIR